MIFYVFAYTWQMLVNRLASRPIYVGDHRALVFSLYGDQFYVDTRDRAVGRTLMVKRVWEMGVTRVLRRLARERSVIVDVGANLGWHTVMMAKRVGAAGRILAFEANPDMIGLLKRNVQINDVNDRVTIEAKAVHSAAGRLTLQVYEELMGGSSLYATAHSAAHFHDEARPVEVEAVALDDYFAPGTRVDVIHADVEGAEPHVVRGARRVIADNPDIVLLLEYSPMMLASSGISIGDFNRDLEGHGFRPYRLGWAGRLVKTTFEELKNGRHCDVLLRR